MEQTADWSYVLALSPPSHSILTPSQIWTSARRRSHHSAWPFLSTSASDPTPTPRVKVIEKPQMAEINPGVWDGLTPEQVRKYFPDEWERFVRDPYAYRAPRAESYHDLCGECNHRPTVTIPLIVGYFYSSPTRANPHRTRTRKRRFTHHRTCLRHSVHTCLPHRFTRLGDSCHRSCARRPHRSYSDVIRRAQPGLPLLGRTRQK